MFRYVRLPWVGHAHGLAPCGPGDVSMQSRNGRPSPPGHTAGGGSVRAQPPDGELASENPAQPPGAGDGGAAADDDQIVLPPDPAPLPPDPARLPPDPARLPPDRPRPPGTPGPPPPVPDELPRRRADPSRPSVPSR